MKLFLVIKLIIPKEVKKKVANVSSAWNEPL